MTRRRWIIIAAWTMLAISAAFVAAIVVMNDADPLTPKPIQRQ